MSRDGRDGRDLTDDRFFDRYPRWSSDGRLLYLTVHSAESDIWLSDLE